MRHHLKTFSICGAAAMFFATAPAQAQGTIKIGVILPFSGPVADTATQMDGGIRLYMKRHGDTVAGKKIEIIRKDTGGIAPDVARRLAQELVVRDGVDILTGFVLTPNALAAAPVSEQAKKPMVIMNAATSIITTKSPYSVRVSMTLPQITEPLGAWAFKNGIKNAMTMVSDYAPGHDAEQGFQRAFKAAGGEILGAIRTPVNNVDFSAYAQRVKDANPQSVFIFVPAGKEPAAVMKSLAERGVTPDKIKILGSGEIVDDTGLQSMGDEALGVITSYHYDRSHNSALNKEFVKDFRAANNNVNPNLLAVGGYDGMHLIYETLKKTGGKADGETFINAAKGMSWESPRGKIQIDPETRDVVQTIYIRKVEKVGGELTNIEFDKVENVKDPVKARMPK
ncbi:MAG: ABC transporter substrate-binding protein [Pseudorhodoplanes sp.]|nr:ABC transporter substrate-binding protein [Pseudorhodoplanes sp.]